MRPITCQKLTPDLKEYIYKQFSDHAIAEMGFDGLSEAPLSFEIKSTSGECIGACVVQIFWGQLHIRYLFVEQKYRRQGIGKQLIAKALQYGHEQGYDFAFVETMSFQAPEFYKKMGFEEELRRDGYAGNTSFYYLKKKLK